MSDVLVAGGMDGVGDDIRHGAMFEWNGRSDESGEVSNIQSPVLITVGRGLWAIKRRDLARELGRCP